MVNIECLTQGYAYIKESVENLSANVGPEKAFMFGNEVLAQGAMESGMDFYAAYPMTPASSLIDVITPDKRVTFFQ
jgi:2-oxoglutarate ferredoxin oxidoreductase subunit alpha